jgi:hypothetical protein
LLNVKVENIRTPFFHLRNPWSHPAANAVICAKAAGGISTTANTVCWRAQKGRSRSIPWFHQYL